MFSGAAVKVPVQPLAGFGGDEVVPIAQTDQGNRAATPRSADLGRRLERLGVQTIWYREPDPI